MATMIFELITFIATAVVFFEMGSSAEKKRSAKFADFFMARTFKLVADEFLPGDTQGFEKVVQKLSARSALELLKERRQQ